MANGWSEQVIRIGIERRCDLASESGAYRSGGRAGRVGLVEPRRICPAGTL